MFEAPANPLYSMSPTTPPGWQGIPYMLGPIVAGMTGGVARPYVPQNMSTYDATIASQVNNPLYKTMMSTMYGQLGTQLGNTMGNLQFVQGIGSMAGYSPAETQRALQGGLGAFARSQMGSFLMPFVDSGLNAAGLTGGSFIAATQAAFNGRMNLMGPGMINPLNAGQQHQAMAAASATATMLNNIMSQRDEQTGKILLSTNQRLMQGFSRERVTQMAMRAAGMGMFSSSADRSILGEGELSTGVGNVADRLAQSVGDPNVDLSTLTLDNFDGKKGGAISKGLTAKKVEAFKNEVTRGMQGLTEAMSAMRDLTGYVDEELEKLLDNVTNGDWARSAKGAFAARDAVRALHATAQAYNIDPKAALNQIITNRTVLQDAAGFGGSMLSMGFNGGGMFGLGAQTELFSGIEDMINARGVRGDAVLSGRLRQQGVQAMARNMNATAGKAAQILAYARQTGVISDQEAGGFAEMLTSGDSGLMTDGLNRLLTTVFGSAETGRKFMNDTMQMNSMRMSMDDSAGKYAMSLTMIGADSEFHRREQVSAASQRLAFTQQALSDSGMNTWQSAAGAGKVVDNIVATIRGDGTDEGRVTDAAAFRQQYDAMVARGMDPRTAASAIVSAYKRSPATAHYAQEIDLAVKQQSAINNEEALVRGGLESRQATALVRALTGVGGIGGKDSADIYRLVREGKGAEALSKVNGIIGGLDSATQKQMDRVRKDAAQKHEAALATMQDNVEAQKLVDVAAGGGYSGEDVAAAYETLAAAGMRYVSSSQEGEDRENFWETVSKSKFASIFGTDALKEYMDAVDRGDTDWLKKMGRRAGSVRRIAVANLKGSGHGLEMSGYWGGGASSVNSAEARKQRDDTINYIAQHVNKDAFLQAGDRDTLATNITDFLMGNRDWKSLLKVYGDKDLESGLAKYGAAFQKYEEAQSTFNGMQDDLNKAIASLGEGGAYDVMGLIQDAFASGGAINIDSGKFSIKSYLGRAFREDGDDKKLQKAKDTIMKAAEARNAVTEAQVKNKEALGDIVADPEMAKRMKGLTSWSAVRKQREAKLVGDSKVAAFVEDFDFSEEGVKGAKGASKAWLDKMFAAVTDEEVAKAVGVDADMEGFDKRKYGEKVFQLVQQKAQQGNSPEATAAMKAARVAQRDAATRIHGEITIKRGWESSPALLEGNVGDFLG